MLQPAFAQNRPALRGGVKEDALKQREQEYEALQVERKKALEAETKLREEIDAIAGDRRKLNAQLIDTAARVRMVEQRIAAAESRLKPLDANEAAIRKSLAGRHALLAEVLAALQRMGRRPPPAVIVQPEDALQSVRSAILLGAVLPEMRQQAETLARDLTELVRLRREIVMEREALARDLTALASDQQRLALLVEGRQKRLTAAESEMEAERQRAAAFARQAENVEGSDRQTGAGASIANPARPVRRPVPALEGRGLPGPPGTPDAWGRRWFSPPPAEYCRFRLTA